MKYKCSRKEVSRTFVPLEKNLSERGRRKFVIKYTSEVGEFESSGGSE